MTMCLLSGNSRLSVLWVRVLTGRLCRKAHFVTRSSSTNVYSIGFGLRRISQLFPKEMCRVNTIRGFSITQNRIVTEVKVGSTKTICYCIDRCQCTCQSQSSVKPQSFTGLTQYIHRFSTQGLFTQGEHCHPLLNAGYNLSDKSLPLFGQHISIRNFSNSSNSDEPDHFQLEKDPELAALLRDISADFKVDKQLSLDSSHSPSQSESGSSSTSDSNWETDSDSSSDSELLEDSPSTNRPAQSTTPDPIVKLDMSESSLSDTNVDGTVLDDDEEFLDEEEYEDFYHDYEDAEEVVPEKYLPISLERGTSGVFDVEELVTLLTEENAYDVCVLCVPAEYKYVDHMVIVTGRSTRHLKAMAELVRWVYKRKRGRGDPQTVKLEGEMTKDWVAIDLGNIAVHFFLEETREKYDLETLWTVGSEFDRHPEEEADPFALFMDQTWHGAEPGTDVTREKTTHGADATRYQTTHSQTTPASDTKSMDSMAGWHGTPSNGTTGSY